MFKRAQLDSQHETVVDNIRQFVVFVVRVLLKKHSKNSSASLAIDFVRGFGELK